MGKISQNQLTPKQPVKDNEVIEIRAVYEENVDKIFRYILSRVGQKELAEDLTSKTFYKVVDKYHTFNPQKSSASTWVFTIARNTMYDYFRNSKSRVQSENLDGERSSVEHLPLADGKVQQNRDLGLKATNVGNKTLENIVKQDRNREVISKVVDKLKPFEQRLLFLRFTQQLSYKEIAKEMGTSVDNVGVRLHRALRKVRTRLKKKKLMDKLDI